MLLVDLIGQTGICPARRPVQAQFLQSSCIGRGIGTCRPVSSPPPASLMSPCPHGRRDRTGRFSEVLPALESRDFIFVSEEKNGTRTYLNRHFGFMQLLARPWPIAAW